MGDRSAQRVGWVTVTSHMTEEAFILDISIDPEKSILRKPNKTNFIGDLFESIEDYSPESWIKELKSIGYKELGEKANEKQVSDF